MRQVPFEALRYSMVLDTDTLGFPPVLLAMAKAKSAKVKMAPPMTLPSALRWWCLDVQLAHGVIARSFHDAAARVLGEPVVTEEVFQLFQRGAIA